MTARTFETADAAVEQLLADGFCKTNYDPIYPYAIAWNAGDAMLARVSWCSYRQRYIIEGIRL